MSERPIAHPFGIDEIYFRSCFSAPSFRIFVALLMGWVLTVGTHTISQVMLTMRLHESRHFASIYRFLARGRWEPDAVSYRLFRLLVDTFVAAGVEILVGLDDTLEKHCGKKICGAGWHHDPMATKHSKEKSYGLCFLVIGLVVRLSGISDRMFFLPYAARLWWPPKARMKPKSLPYKTKPQLGLDLINLTHSWLEQGERLHMVADMTYACRTIIRNRPQSVHFTGRVRMDSALHDLPPTPEVRRQGRPPKKGPRLPTPAAMFRDPDLEWEAIEPVCYGKKTPLLVHTFVAIWYYPAGNEPLRFVLSHDPSGTHNDAVFFDTDVEASPAEIVMRYAARWSIEVTNRETKQLLGVQGPQCRAEQSVIRAPLFAYWAYSFVVLWFVTRLSCAKGLVARPAPWYRQKKHHTFSDMLAAARRSHFVATFSWEPMQIPNLPKTYSARSTCGYKYTGNAKL